MLSFGRDISVSGMDALVAIGEHHRQFVVISVYSYVFMLSDLKFNVNLYSLSLVVASLTPSKGLFIVQMIPRIFRHNAICSCRLLLF